MFDSVISRLSNRVDRFISQLLESESNIVYRLVLFQERLLGSRDRSTVLGFLLLRIDMVCLRAFFSVPDPAETPEDLARRSETAQAAVQELHDLRSYSFSLSLTNFSREYLSRRIDREMAKARIANF